MLRHVVVLTFTEQTPSDTIDSIAAELRTLPDSVPTIRGYTVGRDLGLAEGNAHLVVIGDFDDEAGYVRYRDDTEHRRIITERILPALSSRSAAQFDC
jgi:endonuclease/exonuclease/phosphatase family metal-dependent hydrolase